jgi:cytidylate kinase
MHDKYKCVVISGPPGAGKTTVSNELAKRLGWFRYSTGALWRERWHHKYPDEEVTFEDFWSKTTLQDNIEANEAMMEMSRKGKVVIDCRYVTAFDKKECLLVFLDADIETRAARLVENGRYKEWIEKVKDILNKREEDEVRMGKLVWPGYDFRNRLDYHLCINSELLSIEEEIGVIMELVVPEG